MSEANRRAAPAARVLATALMATALFACSGSAPVPSEGALDESSEATPPARSPTVPSATAPSQDLASGGSSSPNPTPARQEPAPGCVDTDTGAIAFFDPPGSVDTFANATNDSGEIAGWFRDALGRYHGFVRAPDGSITTLRVPGAISTVPSAMNESGDIVGVYFERAVHLQSQRAGDHGFLRTADGTITTLDFAEASEVTLAGISDSGAISGFAFDDEGSQVTFVRAPDGSITIIEPPNSLNTRVQAMNGRGDLGGTYSVDSGRTDLPRPTTTQYLFVWSPEGPIVDFDVPDGAGRFVVWALNDAGDLAGEFDAFRRPDDPGTPRNRPMGFVRPANGTVTEVDPPGSTHSFVRGINDEGSVVGSFVDRDDVMHGFVRSTTGAFTTIDVPGATRTVAYLLGNSGTIIGHFARPGEDGHHGFIWTPGTTCRAR